LALACETVGSRARHGPATNSEPCAERSISKTPASSPRPASAIRRALDAGTLTHALVVRRSSRPLGPACRSLWQRPRRASSAGVRRLDGSEQTRTRG
jgi:hypothetical protein